MKGLIWFRHDLRLADNPALATLSRHCKKAIMLYIIDPEWFKPSRFQTKHLGRFREEFLYQSLRALENELKKRNQKIIIKVGHSAEIIPELCKKHAINLVTINDHPGVYERQQVDNLKRILPCEIIISESFSLFLQHQLSFDKNKFPHSFTHFKKHIEEQHFLPCIPISAPDNLPECINERKDFWGGQEFSYDLTPYHGGEDAALVQLNQYFWKTNGLKKHQKTKNELDGWQFSSKLSAWLANGSLSVRFLAAELDKYEYRHKSTPSTKALFCELLQREYFQWMMHHYGAKMFAFEGIKNKRPLTSFLGEKFNEWEQGTTPFPLVNACMRQLKQTGYLSNRGRKIVARCLVNTLGLDWRFGAAYFEQQLIDFDVAINYGNWQGVANVGSQEEQAPYMKSQKEEMEEEEHGSDLDFVTRWATATSPKSLLRF